ncbi:FAD binding domain-containing protein [Microbacterium sp. JZ37]|uniref:FAD binding domain-containing protein n=1 Tax=Microbacterium sp. JZ37 TaxID=2654193 RepID=UPI002B47F2C6|nr:FAD binding domain-containing protein [Microbacterium sp. JZ37]WRH18634.1 FAD-binding molybdopterin dehydrogenase [Microbacterium sp. JZ37]
MDLNAVETYRRARSRADLALAPGEVPLAGGTLLFSAPSPLITGLVDLTTLGWPDLEPSADGLRIGATCPIARLVAFAEGRDALRPDPTWTAVPLFADAAHALLASFKIWNTATVGGNIAQSYAAAAMVALGTALDAEALIWTPDGGERRMPVAEIPAGNGLSSLSAGEIIRAIDIPARALRSRAALRRIALAELGRSGAVVIGRVDEGGAAVFGITASVARPVVLRWPSLPSAADLRAAVAGAQGWYTDPLGAADWRRGVSVVLAERCRAALAEGDAE